MTRGYRPVPICPSLTREFNVANHISPFENSRYAKPLIITASFGMMQLEPLQVDSPWQAPVSPPPTCCLQLYGISNSPALAIVVQSE